MSSCGGSGACQSNCHRDDEPEDPIPKLPGTATDHEKLCSKCKESDQIVVYNGLCAACFRSSLFNKFKLAVTSNAMISPTDRILLAFSGGPASRVVLQFVHEMQYKALKNWDASKSQSLPVFGVGVAFIDESVLGLSPSHEVEREIEDIRSIVSDLAPAYKELHIVPIENICSMDFTEGRRKLKQLLQAIVDDTGREDFLRYLRMISLQKIALESKYNKLMLGSCTSAIACHIISSTVKGQGYSLPADLQYVDARWEVPVVLPLRDCLSHELSMLCHLDGLKTQELLARPCSSINSLVSSFVARLQVENPSRERTIVRTAEKLKPFPFNKFIENGYHDFVPSRLRPKFQNMKNGESSASEVLCATCGSPLSELDMQSPKSIHGKLPPNMEMFISHCCESCITQILPKDAPSFEHFYSLLPRSMVDRANGDVCAGRGWLREQIKDCLLSDNDDGT